MYNKLCICLSDVNYLENILLVNIFIPKENELENTQSLYLEDAIKGFRSCVVLRDTYFYKFNDTKLIILLLINVALTRVNYILISGVMVIVGI